MCAVLCYTYLSDKDKLTRVKSGAIVGCTIMMCTLPIYFNAFHFFVLSLRLHVSLTLWCHQTGTTRCGLLLSARERGSSSSATVPHQWGNPNYFTMLWYSCGFWSCFCGGSSFQQCIGSHYVIQLSGVNCLSFVLPFLLDTGVQIPDLVLMPYNIYLANRF